MNIPEYKRLSSWCAEKGVTLVAVSKTHPPEAIKAMYDLGQRHFGENKVQELVSKYEALPKDIHWHLIGHLQTNKVRYIAPFVYMVHSVDSADLLKELNKQALKNNRVIDYLLQVRIAKEETKFGIKLETPSQPSPEGKELDNDKSSVLTQLRFPPLWEGSGWGPYTNTRLRGLMGMATNTEDREQVRKEFHELKQLFDALKYELKNEALDTLSMGMSTDHVLAVEEGSTLIRVGSLLFGQR